MKLNVKKLEEVVMSAMNNISNDFDIDSGLTIIIKLNNNVSLKLYYNSPIFCEEINPTMELYMIDIVVNNLTYEVMINDEFGEDEFIECFIESCYDDKADEDIEIQEDDLIGLSISGINIFEEGE